MNYKGSLMAVALIAMPLTAHTQPEVTATGTGSDLAKATVNSHISAHFQCGRKGYWADLDDITVVKTDLSSYVISGGSKRITQHHVTIKTSCITDYQRYPSDLEPTN